MFHLKTKFYFFLLFCFFVVSNYSYSETSDSLLNLINKEENEKRKIDLYIELSDYLLQQKNKIAINYLDSAILIAENKEFTKQIVFLHQKKGDYYYKNKIDKKALEFYEKSRNGYQKLKAPKKEIEVESQIAKIYYFQKKYEKSIVLYENILKKASALSDTVQIVEAYKSIGNAYMGAQKYPSALINFLKAIEIVEKTTDAATTAMIYNNIGLVYYYQGVYEQALEYYLKSLKIFEKIGNKNWISYAYNNLGGVYHLQKNYTQALDYYEKTLKIKQDFKDKTGIARAYQNMGGVYEEMEKYDDALTYFFKSLELNKTMNDSSLMAFAYNSVGIIYKNKQENLKAETYLLKSLKIRERLGDKSNIAKTLHTLGELYYNQKNIKKALDYTFKSYKIADDLKLRKLLQLTTKNLSEIYSDKKDYKNAFVYYKMFKENSDSLYNETNTKKMTQLQMQYQFDKKEEQIRAEQLQREIQQKAELRRQKTIRNASFIGLALMLALAFVIYRNYQTKNKANKMLEISNEQIKKQRDEIAEKNKHITASIVYAERIQKALLPPQEIIKHALTDFFIIYRPRDIVSGDFYWSKKVGDYTCIVAADCTGHGVPGAFVSMLGVAFLNEIVNKTHTPVASNILNDLRTQIKTSLQNVDSEGNKPKDGMDMALCIVNRKEMKMQYAGAMNPLYAFKREVDSQTNQEKYTFNETKADKNPIGAFLVEKPFTNHVIDVEEGDLFYIFSDGYIDQIGGPKEKRFLSKRFKKILGEISDKPMKEQKQVLEEQFNNWKKNYEQMDDVLVMGIKI